MSTTASTNQSAQSVSSPPSAPGEVPRAAGLRRMAAAAVLLLAVLVAAIYYPVSRFEFIDYDTYEQVLLNPYIKALTPGNLAYIFTTRCITSYYPVRTLTYALDYGLWGLTPGGFKLTNVAFHLANVLLVFVLVWRVLGEGSLSPGNERPRVKLALAALAGAVFAAHPVAVEPAIWVPGREELLMTLGALGTFHLYLAALRLRQAGASRPRQRAAHAGAALCCAAACLSNAVGVVIPALVGAWILVMVPRRDWLRAFLPTLPLWAISLATLVVKLSGQQEGAVDLVHVTRLGRVMIGLNAYWLDLKTVVWPVGLCLHYDWLYPKGFLDPNVLAGIAAVALSLGALWFVRRQKAVLFGFLWFGIALAPTLQLHSHHIHRADRFLYLPLAGALVAAAVLVWQAVRQGERRRAAAVAIAVGVVLVATLAVRSTLQVSTWRTNLSVWEQCLSLDPDNARVHDIIGDHFSRLGQVEQAIEHYETALRLRPYAVETLEAYGYLLANTEPQYSDYPRAVELLERAWWIVDGNDDSVRRSRSDVHGNYAVHLQHAGDYRGALREYELALEADPEHLAMAYNLALLLATCPDERLRRPDEAVRVVELARQKESVSDLNGCLIAATAYAQAGRFGAAVIATQEAVELARAARNRPLVDRLEQQREAYRRMGQIGAGKSVGPPSQTLPRRVE